MGKARVIVAAASGGLLLLSLLTLFGDGRLATVADKASVPLAVGILGVAVLRGIGQAGSAPPIALRIVLGVLGGVLGGYLCWNALTFLAAAIRGGRFDFAASWGVLLLAAALACVIVVRGKGRA